MRPKRVLPALAALLLLLTGCGSRPAWRAERLGGMAYSVKTLSGMFYTYEDELYLLSGTETPEGASSQVFVYNVDRDELAMSRHLEDGRSMTAFCEGAEEVYFSAIGSGNVYAWSKSGGEPRLLARLEGTNIYALAWDGADALYAAYGASSGAPAALYRIALPGGQAEIISSGFTEEKYVRSMSYVNGACYLGIGTKAALVKVDAASGEWRSVGEWPDEAFVYDQAVYGDKILFVLSPSCRILEYDARTGAVSDTGVLHQETNAPPPADSFSPSVLSGTERSVDLLGELLLVDEAGILGGYETGGKTSFLDAASGVIHTLNTSGVYMRKDLAGNILFQRDLGGLLEKDYVLPTEFQVYDGVFYAPGRRFAVRDGAGEKTFLVSDEPQASAVTADGVYTANYTDCTLYFYPFETFAGDPEAVWMNDPERFLLADIENQCRPSQMEPTPDGKYLVIGSGPMYGRFGGAVSVYDLERRALLYTHENVVEGHQIQSVKCSAARPGCVWLGTNPYGENTTPQYLDEPSHLILWDIRGERALLDLVPDEDSQKLGSIAELDGRVFCVTQAAHLLSFDAESGEALSANRKDGVREVLAVSDGRLLGVNDGALFSIDPETLRTRTLAKGFRFLHHLTEDPVTGELYVFDYAELARLTPGEGP